MLSSDLARRLELTITDPAALPRDVHKAAADAMEHGLAAIAVTPAYTARVATMLRGSGVRLVTVVGHPAGTHKPTLKAIEATSTLKDGADEIDVTPFRPNLLTNQFDAARAELLEIVRAARSTRRDARVTVTIDPAAATDPAIELACRAARESGCDAVKIAADSLRRLKPHAAGLVVKTTLENTAAAESLLAAGADLLCATSAVILNETV